MNATVDDSIDQAGQARKSADPSRHGLDPVRRQPIDEWKADAARAHGDDPMGWKFVCPSCNYVASVADWKAAGASEGAVAFSCVGRYTGDAQAARAAAFTKKGGPCNYTSGGLFCINTLFVVLPDGQESPAFEVAP